MVIRKMLTEEKIKCTLNTIIFQKDDFIIASFDLVEEKKEKGKEKNLNNEKDITYYLDNPEECGTGIDFKKLQEKRKNRQEWVGKNNFSFDPFEDYDSDFDFESPNFKISDTIKAKGTIVNPQRGVIYTLSGSWENNARYGKTFKVNDYEVEMPSNRDDIISYLSDYGVGVGHVTAKRIVDMFGVDTLKVIKETPIEELKEKIGDRKFRSSSVLEKLQLKLKEIENGEQRYLQAKKVFKDTSVSKRVINKIIEDLGGGFIDIIKADPYALIYKEEYTGIAFLTADTIAKNVGFNMDSLPRYKACIIYTLDEFSHNGNVYMELDIMKNLINSKYNIGRDKIEEAINTLINEDKVIVEKERIYLSKWYKMEKYIAEKLYNLMKDSNGIPPPEKIEYFDLQEDQRQALDLICANKVSILNGFPGSGKSFTINALIKNYNKYEIKLTAPTGKASKRISELTEGKISFTIHKLLEPLKDPMTGKFEFTRNENNTIDADMIILDEFSMVGTDLLYYLLRAVENSTKILFVGDSAQLSSISPGMLLHDLLSSQHIPSFGLSTIKRQSPGRVITNCHAIRNGRDITIDNSTTSDFFLIPRHNEDDIVAEILDLVKGDRLTSRLPGIDKLMDIQIATPHNSATKCSCDYLNTIIQQSINNESPYIYKSKFKINEKIINVKNDYNLNIMNGDMGIMLDGIIDEDDKGNRVECFKVKFFYPDRIVSIPLHNHNLKSAMAVSIHKLQGSEIPIIIMPFLRNFSPLLMTRNLLYTAISRAKKMFIGIGHINMIPEVIRRVRVNDRKTTLREFIMEKFKS